MGSIALSLLVPLLHLNLDIPAGSLLERPAREVSHFRDAYAELISLLDADFGKEPGMEHAREGGSPETVAGAETGDFPREERHGEGAETGQVRAGAANWRAGFFPALSGTLLILYVCGVLYFLVRLIYLLVRLRLISVRNGVNRRQEFKLVEIREDIAPFSFFRLLFVNPGIFNDSELHLVLEHERAHIRQRHSADHLFAHAFAVFQWFNPLAWQIRRALKTTHEYIADRHVLEKGIRRNDYQALLLKQVVGYHSVELVNNFNLKPIKNRIAMMNKHRSGTGARLKATLVIPVSLMVFFLFAEFTLNGGKQPAGPEEQLSGLWIRQSKDNFPASLYIDGRRFTYATGMEIKAYDFTLSDGEIIFSVHTTLPDIYMQYQMKGDELSIWWNDDKESRYVRSKSGNTLDHWIAQQETAISADLPSISRYRLLEEDRVFRICYGKDPRAGNALTFNGKSFTLADLPKLLEKEKSRLSKLDQGSLTALFLVDREIPMVLVDQVRQVLRETGTLHFAEGGYPHGDLELSPLLYHAVGLPRVLPPPDAKVLDKEDLFFKGGGLHVIDLSARNTSPRELDEKLKAFIGGRKDGRYVISLEYDGAIPYGQYVETVDLVWNTVYTFREALSMEKYGLPYEQLGDDLQREIRKAYPMALSETLKDRTD